jgi:hypothetical protein
LETHPGLSLFAWSASSYQHYTDILFLLTETLREPALPLHETRRICTLADHIFGHCYGVTALQRARDILVLVKDTLDAVGCLKRPKKPRRREFSSPVLTTSGVNGHMSHSSADAMLIPWVFEDQSARPSGSDLDVVLNTFQQQPQNAIGGTGEHSGFGSIVGGTGLTPVETAFGFPTASTTGMNDPMEGVFGLGKSDTQGQGQSTQQGGQGHGQNSGGSFMGAMSPFGNTGFVSCYSRIVFNAIYDSLTLS